MKMMCQGCGEELETWVERCGKCGATAVLRLTPSPDRMLGRVVKGGFKIVRRIGQGGMGAVYLAEKEGLGQKVALKFLNSNLLGDAGLARRFLNEAKTYARISHPNAVTLHDFAQEDDGSLFIAMEFVDGVDLKRFMTERGRLRPVETIEIALQVADVLHHAHERGVVHRDLKPENVMVREGLRGLHVKVLDFGIARLVEEGVSRLTVQGSIAGTPRYMAPEQVEGKDVDARADVYALGVVVFEMLTAVNPFDAPVITEILRNQVVLPMPHLADVAGELDYPALDAVIQKATAKARVERYASMQAFAQDLSNALPTLSGHEVLRMGSGTSAAAEAGSSSRRRVPQGERETFAGVEPVPVEAQRVAPAEGERTLNEVPAGTQLDPVASAGTLIKEPPRSPFDGFSKTAHPHVPHAAPAAQGSSRGVMIGVIAAVGVALAGGALFIMRGGDAPAAAVADAVAVAVTKTGSPDPVQTPQTTAEPGPGAETLPADLQARQAFLAKEMLLKARAAFTSGELEETIQLAQVIPDDPLVRADAEKLQADAKDAQRRLAQGRALAARGDCVGAIKVYDALLAAYPSVKEARSGRARCRAMLPPEHTD